MERIGIVRRDSRLHKMKHLSYINNKNWAGDSDKTKVICITACFNWLRLVYRHSIAENFVVADGVPAFGATITCIAFYGVDIAVFDLFYDAYMV